MEWYHAWCKRPTFSDEYLQAFNPPNVHLVDTDGRGVESADEKCLVSGGSEYPLHVLVLSTGFVAPSAGGGDPALRSEIRISGRKEQERGRPLMRRPRARRREASGACPGRHGMRLSRCVRPGT